MPVLCKASSTGKVRNKFLELRMRNCGGVYLAEGNIERREGGVIGDCFRVDEEASVVLGLEQLIVVAIGVGGVV